MILHAICIGYSYILMFTGKLQKQFYENHETIALQHYINAQVYLIVQPPCQKKFYK
jgi:hypothetical protein